MHEDELRALVREAVSRHLGVGGDGRPGRPSVALTDATVHTPAAWKTHVSHGRFIYLAPAEPDSPCIVEPQVRCHHCGFCQSYGH